MQSHGRVGEVRVSAWPFDSSNITKVTVRRDQIRRSNILSVCLLRKSFHCSGHCHGRTIMARGYSPKLSSRLEVHKTEGPQTRVSRHLKSRHLAQRLPASLRRSALFLAAGMIVMAAPPVSDEF